MVTKSRQKRIGSVLESPSARQRGEDPTTASGEVGGGD